ncbi:MAG: FkbM family methyltransferase [Candidatus Magasanikbacteria bacterium]|nr:FkbM family methyltransferase [Candidatus Magasanikbacteria bacterium]
MDKKINFNHRLINIAYRDDSDLSVIDEFFVDKMYKSVECLISNSQFPILDIGAHIGVFSIYSKIINPKSKIIAIEPGPDNFALLKQNISANDLSDIKIQQTAIIGTEEKTTTLYLSKNSHNHSTIKPSNNLTIQQFNNSTITVPATSLEKLIKQNKIKKIGLLKMDIEGAEFDIVLNIDNETWGKIRYVMIEYHESESDKRENLENIIRQHGFSVEHFPNKFDKGFGLLVCRNKKVNLND